MNIKEIKINNYGKLKNKEINLEKNINIIYGENESGKSTLLNYIKNIFYGISKNKNGKEISDYEKYKPWIGEEFSGRIKYELNNGEEYEIFRDFNKKNPKVLNGNLEDISKDFNIDKKDGSQFFYEQTGIDENMYLSTIMTEQQEVVLDGQEQNVLVQKLANIMGTGEDSTSYKKVLDRLNKKQIEEVGTSRTQDRPINLVNIKLKNNEFDKKAILAELESKTINKEDKNNLQQKLLNEEIKNRAIREINFLAKNCELELEKNNLKNNIKKENEEKINKLNNNKNELLKNNSQINLEKEKINKLNNKKNKIFLLLFIILIIINIFSFLFIKNKIINYLFISLIPIFVILYILLRPKNKNIKKVDEKINSIKNEVNLINNQIKLLEEENIKKINEIENEKNNIILNINKEKEKIKNKYNNIEINKIINLINKENIEKELEYSNNKINEYKLEISKIDLEEKNILPKKEKLIKLEEEQEELQERLKELNEKNLCFNLTRELLEKAYEKMKTSVTPKFTENLSKNISIISNGKYNKVGLNDENGLMVEQENGDYLPAYRLSVGTIDQLYLSLRLSMVDDISKESMPIILDEAFAYFDTKRLENILKYLAEKSEQNQILIFTCTKREKEIFDKLNIKYNLVEL